MQGDLKGRKDYGRLQNNSWEIPETKANAPKLKSILVMYAIKLHRCLKDHQPQSHGR